MNKHRAVLYTFTPALLAALSALRAANVTPPDFQSKHLAVGLSSKRPAFSWLTVESLGEGKLGSNPVLAETHAVDGLAVERGILEYWRRRRAPAAGHARPLVLQIGLRIDSSTSPSANCALTAPIWPGRG